MKKIQKELLSALEEWFSTKQKVAVAYSGGVDSSLLLFLGSKVLGRNCVGLFADSPLVARHQVEAAKSFAKQFGLVLEERIFSPLDLPGFSENKKNRCYICKKSLYHTLEKSLEPGWHLVDGTNLDDNPDERPGFQAIQELGVATPFLDCRINKKQIRDISRTLGLSSWNKPSDSCLATRIPRHCRLSREILQKVEDAEEILHNFGFDGVRAKLHGDEILLTFKEGDLERALILEVAKNIRKKMMGCSFSKVFLDLSERPGILP
ncbi:MAG: ATP-dependent sacrificial sulfur transferase LarE [Thermodesulfobacteriota bacterium]